MKLRVSAENLDELRAFVKAYPKMVKALIGESKAEVEDYVLGLIKEGTPVDTGRTKRAWSSVSRKGGLSFRNPEVSAKVLERGLYPGVGPKTVQTGRGIFSTQAPEGILTPIAESQKIKDNISQIFTDSLLDNLRQRL